MGVSDIILKLWEYHHYPDDWNNKVVDDELSVFR